MSRTLIRASLVGRDPELEALGGLVRRARGGGLAVVEGEAGIGKTRLIEAALELAREERLRVLASRAEELDAHRPFAPIVDCVASAGSRAWTERMEETLRAEQPSPGMGPSRQFRAAELLLELLEELCDRSPAVVAIEDLHWADPASLSALAFVARGVEKLPLLLVVSARPQPRRPELEQLMALLEARTATRVALGPLDDDACAALVERLVAAQPGPHLLAQARGAAGNPLFVSQLVEALRADGALETRDGMADAASADGIPPLPMTILHRLSFLPREELELLGLAALLGTSFRVADLALLARRPAVDLLPVLRAAQRAGVLAERDERLAFRHELIRDALYEDMPVSVRRALHQDLAQALADAGEPPERVAEHVLRSAEPGDERAVAALTSAARQLVSRGPAAAADLYRHAIETSANPDDARAALQPELAEALIAAGLLGEGEAACREALEQGTGAEWHLRLRHHLVLSLIRRGHIVEAVQEAEAALAGPPMPGPERDQIRAWLAHARLYSGDVDGSVRDARALLAEEPADLPRILALDVLALVSYTRGFFARAADEIEESWKQVEASGSRTGYEALPHVVYGKALERVDRFDDAYAALQSGRRALESLGMLDVLPTGHFSLALVDYQRGRLDDALAELSTQFELTEHTEAGWKLTGESLYSLICLHRDDLLTAEQHLTAAEAEAAAGGSSFAIEIMILTRALLLETHGETAAALDTLAGAFEQFEAAGAAMVYATLGPELARLAVAAGNPARAAGVPAALERVAEQNPGAAGLEAAALRARGLIEGDADCLLAAVELARKSGRRLELARTAEDAAAVIGEGEQARDLLDDARVLYEEARAMRDIARVDAALRGLGVRKGVRGRRKRAQSGWEALTETELKVVRLVAERLTNPEIAERLFISRRTVQTHVSHALAKVGVSSRRELAAEAARRAGWRIRLEGGAENVEQPEPAGERLPGSVVDGHGA